MKTNNKLKKTGAFMLFMAVFLTTAKAQPDESYCYKDPYILDCFDSLKTNLKPNHQNQLNKVADDITGHRKEAKAITLIGHGVQYLESDPVTTNANKRAKNVKRALIKKLKSRGIDTDNIAFNAYGVADKAPINNNSNQTKRALSRRVEVLVDYKKKPPKKDIAGTCKKRPAIAKALTGMPEHKRPSVNCLAKKYKQHFTCGTQLTGGYRWGYGEATAIETVPRFLRGKPPHGDHPCKSLTGKKLRSCLKRIDDEIWMKPKYFLTELNDSYNVLNIPAKVLRKTAACKFLRGLHKKSKDPQKIYSCYKREFAEKFEMCL